MSSGKGRGGDASDGMNGGKDGQTTRQELWVAVVVVAQVETVTETGEGFAVERVGPEDFTRH